MQKTFTKTAKRHLSEQQDRHKVDVDDDGELLGSVVERAGLADAFANVVDQDVQGTAESLFRLGERNTCVWVCARVCV